MYVDLMMYKRCLNNISIKVNLKLYKIGLIKTADYLRIDACKGYVDIICK